MRLSGNLEDAQVSTRYYRTLLKISPQVSPEQAEQQRGASKPQGRASRHHGEECGLLAADRDVSDEPEMVKWVIRAVWATTQILSAESYFTIPACVGHTVASVPRRRTFTCFAI